MQCSRARLGYHTCVHQWASGRSGGRGGGDSASLGKMTGGREGVQGMGGLLHAHQLGPLGVDQPPRRDAPQVAGGARPRTQPQERGSCLAAPAAAAAAVALVVVGRCCCCCVGIQHHARHRAARGREADVLAVLRVGQEEAVGRDGRHARRGGGGALGSAVQRRRTSNFSPSLVSSSILW